MERWTSSLLSFRADSPSLLNSFRAASPSLAAAVAEAESLRRRPAAAEAESLRSGCSRRYRARRRCWLIGAPPSSHFPLPPPLTPGHPGRGPDPTDLRPPPVWVFPLPPPTPLPDPYTPRAPLPSSPGPLTLGWRRCRCRRSRCLRRPRVFAGGSGGNGGRESSPRDAEGWGRGGARSVEGLCGEAARGRPGDESPGEEGSPGEDQGLQGPRAREIRVPLGA